MEEAGIDLSYSGALGSVLARLTSLDATGEFSFDVPIKDPLGGGAYRISGNYPWRLDGGYNTVVHLKNTIDQEVYALVQVRYEGGTYNPERIKLAPYQTVAVNLRELRDNQEKDVRGGVMPGRVASGQVLWYEEEPGSLIGRAETSNLQAGVASSFSCGGSCPGCTPWFHSAYMSPASYSGVVAEQGRPFIPNQKKIDCYGTIYGPYDMTFSSTWASLNTAVASVVSSNGWVTCLTPGTAGIRATFPIIPIACGFPTNATASPTGGLTVCDTNLAGPTSVTRGSSQTYSICSSATNINWQFSGGGGTVTKSGGTSWSGTMVSSGTVTVTFTYNGQPYTRPKSVTVNNRNWHTNPASATKVPNGTFISLPVPPQQTGIDSGLGAAQEATGNSGFSHTVVAGGPNNGYVYYAAIPTWSPYLFRYTINPDLENSASTFSQKQWGNCGFISWSNLLAQTRRHEYNSLTQSHYAFYKNSMNSSSNNPGEYVESRVLSAPATATQITQFNSDTQTGLNSRYTQILSQTSVEPYPVNYSESNQFLGNVNYAPYANCP